MPFLYTLINMGIGLLPIPTIAKEVVKLLLVSTLELVQDFTSAEFKELKGADKRAFVVKQVAELVDAEFDQVPFWNNLAEDERDRLIAGVVEWALLIDRSTMNMSGSRPERMQKRIEKMQRKAILLNKRADYLDRVVAKSGVKLD